jgi:hypothetical protein
MRRLSRLLPIAAVLLLFYAASCKKKENAAAPSLATPPAGTPGTVRSFAPVPTRVPVTHLPGQPTPLPELPG